MRTNFLSEAHVYTDRTETERKRVTASGNVGSGWIQARTPLHLGGRASLATSQTFAAYTPHAYTSARLDTKYD